MNTHYDEQLHSHYFKQTVNGVEHDFRVTENEGKFCVERDGILIAEISHYENWEQTSGEWLDSELFNFIVEWIERNFE